jgi:hypothetical protein
LAASIAKLFGAGIVLVRAYQSPPKPVGGWSAEDHRKLDEVPFRQEEAMKELEEVPLAARRALGASLLLSSTDLYNDLRGS